MYPHRLNRYCALPRPLSFDRRAFGVLCASGELPGEVDRQLSAVHRRHLLRDALRSAISATPTEGRVWRRPPS